MNKNFAFVLAIFLLLINTRLVKNIHLCKNHICSIQTFLEDNLHNCCHKAEKSCCSIEKKDKDCCKDIVIKQNFEDLFIKKFNYEFSFFILDQKNSNTFLSQQLFYHLKINAFEIQSHAPPLYKLYQQYVFYA